MPQFGHHSQPPLGFNSVTWKRACWDSAQTVRPYKRRDDCRVIVELQPFVMTSFPEIIEVAVNCFYC